MFDCSEKELQKIDQQLNPMLKYAQTKVIETQQLALDATRLLSCTEERFNEYQGQGFFKRCWSALYGKTGEIQRANQKDLITMQKYSWRYINLLQERDLLLGHSLLTVRNNLLTLAINEEETRKEITRMAERILGRFQDLEDRMKKVEAAITIHNWLLTIATRDYDEKYSPHFRLLRLIKDFLLLKETDWNINEIRCIQKALIDVGLPWKREITLSDFINELIEEIECSNFSVYQDLLFVTFGKSGGYIPESFIIENIAVPSFNSLYNLASNYSGTSSTIEILCDQLNITRKDALKKVLFTYIKKQGINLEIKLPLRDLAVEILSCMRLSQNLFNPANQGNSTAQAINGSKSGHQISAEENIEQESDEEIDEIIKLAEAGDIDAQMKLSSYYDDEGADNDPEKAFFWLKKAAEQGSMTAQFMIATEYYYSGCSGADQDFKQAFKQAFKWYKKAAEQGMDSAQCRLGDMYYSGEFVSQDFEKAAQWYTKAAEQGSTEAQLSLASMFAGGTYFAQSDREAFKLYMKAADEKNSAACIIIAAWYLIGRSVTQDFQKAKEYVLKCLNIDSQNSEEVCRELLEWCVGYFRDDSSFYYFSEMPDAKKFNAAETFLSVFEEGEEIIIFYDGTFFGSAKNGFAIGPRRIAWKNELTDIYHAPLSWKGFKNVVVMNQIIKLDHPDFEQRIECCLASSGQVRTTLAHLIELLHIISDYSESNLTSAKSDTVSINLDNGPWIGYFQQGDIEKSYVNRGDFTINFRTGSSDDIMGEVNESRTNFGPDVKNLHSIITDGYYDAANRKIQFTKKYDYDGHIVNYEGTLVSDDLITGSWNIGSEAGTWQAIRNK